MLTSVVVADKFCYSKLSRSYRYLLAGVVSRFVLVQMREIQLRIEVVEEGLALYFQRPNMIPQLQCETFKEQLMHILCCVKKIKKSVTKLSTKVTH